MAGLGLFYLVFFIGYLFVFCYPISRVLKRLGFSGWLALLAIVPLGNLIGLWMLAFKPWPRDARAVEAFS
jgi:hypothetical protein